MHGKPTCNIDKITIALIVCVAKACEAYIIKVPIAALLTLFTESRYLAVQEKYCNLNFRAFMILGAIFHEILLWESP